MPVPTRIDDVMETIHGVQVRDPYRWLEDGDDPEVRAWVAAQSAHTRAYLDALPGRPAIAERIRQALDVGRVASAVPRGRYLFLTRRDAGKEQIVLAVSEAGGPIRVLVDPAPLSEDRTTALAWWTPSPDGELVCVGISEAGADNAELRILRTATGEWLSDRIARCPWSAVAFEPGGASILYTRMPEPGTVPSGEEVYHRHVWRHVLGTEPAEDVRVFGEGRDKLDMPSTVSISEDGRWTLVVVSRGWNRTSMLLREREGAFVPVFEGIGGTKTFPWFAGNRLLAITDLDAPNARLVEIDPAHPEPARWMDVVPESEHVLVDVAVSSDRLVVHHLVDACSRMTLFLPDGTFERVVELPPFSAVRDRATLEPGLGADPSSPDVYVTVQSPTRPPAIQRVGGGVVFGVDPPHGFEASRHPVRQVWYRSPDGTRVPMFMIGRGEGLGPTVLTGYGGFKHSMTPIWMSSSVPFLESGGLLAVPSLRGGGEFGEPWHRAGMLDRKQNVFDDFIAAAEWLVAEGFATPERLGIFGGSNGGLLVGAAMTQRPDLFRAVVCRVPVLDMVRYERFRVAELYRAEYGSAADPTQFGWLHAYSPYHRVRDGVRYPDVLLTCGEEDGRVDPLHARKMAARLQAADPTARVLLRTEPRAGHGQGKPVAKMVPEEADVWAFLLAALGSG